MKKTFYILICTLPWLVSCQDNEVLEVQQERVPIVLSASITPSMDADTRAAFELQYPTVDNPLKAAVWLSTSGNFLNNNTTDESTYIEAETTINFQNKDNQLIKNNESDIDIVYPSSCIDDNHPVYFVGLYPWGGWNFTSGSTNSTTFITYTGDDDLMFAPKVLGFKAISPNPKLHFYHMLTHLRVEVKAADADVATSWGKLTSLTLTNTNRKLILNDLTTVPDLSKVSFDDPGSLDFYASANPDNIFSTEYPSGLALTNTATEVAYVLCEPVDATVKDGGDNRTEEYTILLNTEKRTAVQVYVDLKTGTGTEDSDYFSGSSMGHEFIITLTFTASGYVSASARITPWATGGYVSQDVEK